MDAVDVLLLLAGGACGGMLLLVLLVRWVIGRTRTWMNDWEGSVDGEMAFLTGLSILLALLTLGLPTATWWV